MLEDSDLITLFVFGASITFVFLLGILYDQYRQICDLRAEVASLAYVKKHMSKKQRREQARRPVAYFVPKSRPNPHTPPIHAAGIRCRTWVPIVVKAIPRKDPRFDNRSTAAPRELYQHIS